MDTIDVDWGSAHTADQVAEALKQSQYDAVCAVHNETSTGVINPIESIGTIIHQHAPDTLFLVDSVSGLLGAEMHMDHWHIDLLLTVESKSIWTAPGHRICSGQ